VLLDAETDGNHVCRALDYHVRDFDNNHIDNDDDHHPSAFDDRRDHDDRARADHDDRAGVLELDLDRDRG
jgi:hypothetical protein